jgi:hypothetical protein
MFNFYKFDKLFVNSVSSQIIIFMEELKLINLKSRQSDQKILKIPQPSISTNNVNGPTPETFKRSSKGPKLSMRFSRKSKYSIPEETVISEEKELTIQREAVNALLGSYKEYERKVKFNYIRIITMKIFFKKLRK